MMVLETRACAACGGVIEIIDRRRQHHKKFCSAECRMASWKEAHPGRFAEYNTVYRRRRGAKPQKYGVDRAKRRLRELRYIARYPERHRQRRALLNAMRRGAPGAYSEAQWTERAAEFFGRCAYCVVNVATERDHLVPVVAGGTNDIDNIVPACRSCNRSKQDSSLLVFLLRRAA